MKSKRAEEESQYITEMEIKRKNLLDLKNIIDHNKEMFQAKVNKNKFNDAKEKQELDDQKYEIQQRGENPNFFIPRKLKMQQFEKEKRYVKII
jgi:hypothetical protein